MATATSEKKRVIRPLETRKVFDKVEIAADIEMTRESVDIARGGDQIVLPIGMTYDEGIAWLFRQREAEETEVAILEEIDAFPLDGAMAFMKALKKKYGWTSLVPSQGFFSTPPLMISIEVGFGRTAQVAWGNVQIPNIDGTLETGFGMRDGRPIFVIKGVVRRKHEGVVHEIAELVRETVKTDSIYRGKAIKMTFRAKDGSRFEKFDPRFSPRFVDASKPGELVLPRDTEKVLRTSLFHPVMFSEQCRRAGIPLKRGVLLEGPFGTGKTLTAFILAHLCELNKWTFIYLDDVRDLDLAIAFARLYQPCVVFAEDVDSAVGLDRDAQVNAILNTIDGVDAKSSEIMVVLTTNAVENIHPAFRRPGRIDAIVHMPPPDNEATVRLVKLYGQGFVQATDEELSHAVKPIVGHNSAVIREAVERAKLSAVSHFEEGGQLVVNAEDIAISAKSMEQHVQLLTGENPEAGKHPADVLFADLAQQITSQIVAQHNKLLAVLGAK